MVSPAAKTSGSQCAWSGAGVSPELNSTPSRSQSKSASEKRRQRKDKQETQSLGKNYAAENTSELVDIRSENYKAPQNVNISNMEISKDAVHDGQCRETGTRKPSKTTSTINALASNLRTECDTQPLGTHSARESPSNNDLNNDGSLEEMNRGHHSKSDDRQYLNGRHTKAEVRKEHFIFIS